ncbi:MAG: VCBS repeat-containing protein [candidate division Zixibacteria bacterium]|nr:VCBS repeat-containing protein [candidate division Zixibacteria bacterium]
MLFILLRTLLVLGLLGLFSPVMAAPPPINGSPFWNSTEQDMYSTGMVWRDCNNDGYIDVYYSNGNDIVMAENTIYISNHGSMPNSASWSSSNNEYSGHCSVGDVNDDGWADFAVANYLGSGGFSTGNLSNLYYNNSGELSLSPDWYTGDSIYSFSCSFGDADGDGDLDLAFATGDGYNDILITDRIFFNIDGELQTSPGWQSTYGTQALDVAWGDIDNDGDLDIAFCYDDRPPALFYNNGVTIESSPSWSALHNESANTIVFGDVNGDGWLDLIVAYNSQLGGGGYFRAYFNNGSGTLNTNYDWQSATGGYGSALALYDYDNDGDNDLAAGRWFDEPRIYENTGSTFSSAPVWRANDATVVEEMSWIDIDRNGVESKIDIISSVSGKKVFYTSLCPLYSFDSIYVDDTKLGLSDYCFDPFYGWVSLSAEPSSEVKLFYQYSYTNDLTTSNWDTVNMAYGNTDTPPVVFGSNINFGFAPLEIQFSDYSISSSDWDWDFGDGGIANNQNPLYTYQNAGVFDVYLENSLPDGRHNHTEKEMIIVLADTLYIPDINPVIGDTIIVPVYLKNAHPLESFVISLSYTGPLSLQYLDFDLIASRADYFLIKDLTAISISSKKLSFNFVAGVSVGNPALEPGDGIILNLKFAPVYTKSQALIDTTTISQKSTICKADFFDYTPAVSPGSISTMVCGDANGDGSISVGDAVYIINYVFRGGFPPVPLSSGDANCDYDVNIGDAVYIINFAFRGGPAPCCP